MRIRIVLNKAEKVHEKATVGNSDGAHAAYERVREQGVRFPGEPYRYPWGVGALLLDQDGNLILLLQESGERYQPPDGHADREALGCVVHRGVRRACLGGGARDPPHSQARRHRSRRGGDRVSRATS